MILFKLNKFKFLIITLSISISIFFITNNAKADINEAKILTTTKNIKIIFLKNINTDLVSVNMAFKDAGSKNDPIGKEGLIHTTLNLLYRSSSNGKTQSERLKLIKELGIINGINVTIDKDNVYIGFKCPQENFTKAINILADSILNPELIITELNKLKTLVTDVKLATTSEIAFATHVLESKIFTKHPYGLPINGLANSIQKINLTDIKEIIKNNFAKNNLFISIVGNLEEKSLIQNIDNSFAKLQDRHNLQITPLVNPKLDGSFEKIIKDSPQTGVCFALQAPKFNSKDYYPMLIINRILAGTPFTSRLWVEIREKRGLVYQISSYINNYALADLLLGYFECDNKDYQQVMDLIINEIKNLQINGITKQELANAKSGLIGEFALKFVSNEEISEKLLNIYLLGSNIKELDDFKTKINQVTLDEVADIIKKYLNLEFLTTVGVGNILY